MQDHRDADHVTASHSQRAMWPALLWFACAYVADSATSLALLSSHGWEVNPLLHAAYALRGAPGLLALKALFALLVIAAALAARYSAMVQSARLARFLLGLGSGVWLTCAFFNLAALSAV